MRLDEPVFYTADIVIPAGAVIAVFDDEIYH